MAPQPPNGEAQQHDTLLMPHVEKPAIIPESARIEEIDNPDDVQEATVAAGAAAAGGRRQVAAGVAVGDGGRGGWLGYLADELSRAKQSEAVIQMKLRVAEQEVRDQKAEMATKDAEIKRLAAVIHMKDEMLKHKDEAFAEQKEAQHESQKKFSWRNVRPRDRECHVIVIRVEPCDCLVPLYQKACIDDLEIAQHPF